MPKIVTTESGTKYRIDLEAKTWERLHATWMSGHLRTESGDIVLISGPVVGERMEIIGSPVVGSYKGRLISTSCVVSVEEECQN
jgi:hypothetical protein